MADEHPAASPRPYVNLLDRDTERSDALGMRKRTSAAASPAADARLPPPPAAGPLASTASPLADARGSLDRLPPAAAAPAAAVQSLHIERPSLPTTTALAAPLVPASVGLPEQQRSVRAVHALTLLFWLLNVLSGCFFYDPRAGSYKYRHPMAAYDLVFKRAGSALPFIPWALRALAAAAAAYEQGVRWPQALRTALRFAPVREPLFMYAIVTVARVALWVAHSSEAFCQLTGEGRLNPGVCQSKQRPHVLADHVLLAASVLSILMAEASLSVVLETPPAPGRSQGGSVYIFAATPTRPRRSLSRMMGMVAFLTSLVLISLTSSDMHYTARFFHPPGEIVASLLAGFFMFQLPVAAWIERRMADKLQEEANRIEQEREQGVQRRRLAAAAAAAAEPLAAAAGSAGSGPAGPRS